MPATIEFDDKTASGKIYIADSRDNLSGLDFIESLGLLDIPLNSVCKTISRSPAQISIIEQTDDTIKRFLQSSHINSNASLKLKFYQHTNHILLAFRPKRPEQPLSQIQPNF